MQSPMLASWDNVTVVTQNVDDYHQCAGSSPVYTVHGNHIHSSCQACGEQVITEGLFFIIEDGEIPYCACGGVYKPNITFFGEMLPEYNGTEFVKVMSEVNLVLVLGTSLAVYPTASLPEYRPWNARLVVINRDPTPLNHEAQLVINEDLCEVMEKLTSNPWSFHLQAL